MRSASSMATSLALSAIAAANGLEALLYRFCLVKMHGRTRTSLETGKDGSNDVFSPTCHMLAITEDRDEVLESADYGVIDIAASSFGGFT